MAKAVERIPELENVRMQHVPLITESDFIRQNTQSQTWDKERSHSVTAAGLGVSRACDRSALKPAIDTQAAHPAASQSHIIGLAVLRSTNISTSCAQN